MMLLQTMLHDIFLAFWFLLPAALANGAPPLAAVLPVLRRLDTPFDFGRQWRGKRLFGAHKTWRGLASGIIAATLTLALQQYAAGHIGWIHQLTLTAGIDYAQLPLLLAGPTFAVGALGGDAAESFLKRQRGIPSGRRWIPFDQLDYVVGAIIAMLPFIVLPPVLYVWMLVVWFAGHIAGSYAGWLLRLKKDPI